MFSRGTIEKSQRLEGDQLVTNEENLANLIYLPLTFGFYSWRKKKERIVWRKTDSARNTWKSGLESEEIPNFLFFFFFSFHNLLIMINCDFDSNRTSNCHRRLVNSLGTDSLVTDGWLERVTAWKRKFTEDCIGKTKMEGEIWEKREEEEKMDGKRNTERYGTNENEKSSFHN